MSYGDYLQLDHILGAQKQLSDDPNELLFIIQHQASELWLKLMIHELTGARDQIRGDDLQPAFKMLARVARIMATPRASSRTNTVKSSSSSATSAAS